MKVLTSKKAIICFLSVSSIVLAGTIKDFHSRTVKLENSQAFEKDLIPVERSVASEAVSRVAQMYLPATVENLRKVNTAWEITRIIGADEKVAFDKFANPEDAKKSIKIPMELIGNGIVRVNKDNEQVYRVSLISEFGTIALFKKLGNGYEILEAKRVVVAKENKALIVAENVELVLERALNQAKSNKILLGHDVSGQVSLTAKTINGLSVELRNPNGETQNIEIDTADLLDGGTFKAEVNGEEVSGVVFNNGKDGYRISFVTGPIAGSMLNFVTKEQMEKVQETEQDAQAENQDSTSAVDEQQAASIVVEERKEVASDADNYQPVRVLSADEIKETAQEKGFAF
jgi:outer membrane lipoprotein SlyB